MEQVYYKKGSVIVRDARMTDLPHLAAHMRVSDINELWASHHLMPLDALTQSLELEGRAMVGLRDDEPFIIFGCNPGYLSENSGIIWMMATDQLYEIKFEFMRYSRQFVDMMLEQYQVLYNFVHAKNLVSIAWLKSIGADIDVPIPYGLDGEMFHYFAFRRKENV